MDILLSNFVKKYIEELNDSDLTELEKFLNFEDNIILDYYHYGIIKNNIDENKISKIFKSYSM